MASRRARTRPDKRQLGYHDGGSPELERALATIAGLPVKPRTEGEDEPITLKTGETIDLRRPWVMPSNEGASS